MIRNPWRHLGIDKTNDTRAIRSAYAAKLKAIDMDADPEGYHRLRDARDQALALARQAGVEEPIAAEPMPAFDGLIDDELDAHVLAEAETAAQRLDASIPTASDPLSVLAVDEPPDPARELAERIGAHYSALYALLHPDDANAPPLDDLHQWQAAEHFEALLDDPRLDHVGFRAEAELHIAQLLAGAVPRSDKLIARAIAYFDWNKQSDDFDLPSAIQYLLHRAKAVRFLDEVQSPDHRFHSAWTELTSPVERPGKKAVKVRNESVHELLRAIRYHQPDLEPLLDPGRVEMWDRKFARGGAIRQTTTTARKWGRFTWLFIVLAFFAIRMATLLVPDGNPNQASPVTIPTTDMRLTSPGADLGPMLLDLSGYGFDQIQARNPSLYRALVNAWADAAQAGRNREALMAEIRPMLRDRIVAGLQTTTSYELVRKDKQLLLDEMQAARNVGVSACVQVANGGTPPDTVVAAFQNQRRDLVGRVLTETSGTNPSANPDGKVMVPTSLIDQAATIAMMPGAELRTALSGKGPEDAQCDARIALFKALLGLPPAKGLPLMQKL